MSYDLISHFVTLPAIPPAAARVADFTGVGVDAQNVEGQCTLTLCGTLTATAVVTIEESDDNSTGWTTVDSPATSAVISKQPPLNIAITATFSVYEVNFQREKRYVRVKITGTGHLLAGTIKGKAKYLGS